ncbi:hypothetical protein BpHYR1_008272 [Brachionus plicatilis]|uniref:Uncharacterized protein n=1 Tax=Brachionus plicatilis TaxID=10195 RepID=A0A3M7STC0_BRAPC|nr:hypothetical protein BpHYR1_008272 [Brachionus plicatilis]
MQLRLKLVHENILLNRLNIEINRLNNSICNYRFRTCISSSSSSSSSSSLKLQRDESRGARQLCD